MFIKGKSFPALYDTNRDDPGALLKVDREGMGRQPNRVVRARSTSPAYSAIPAIPAIDAIDAIDALDAFLLVPLRIRDRPVVGSPEV